MTAGVRKNPVILDCISEFCWVISVSSQRKGASTNPNFKPLNTMHLLRRRCDPFERNLVSLLPSQPLHFASLLGSPFLTPNICACWTPNISSSQQQEERERLPTVRSARGPIGDHGIVLGLPGRLHGSRVRDRHRRQRIRHRCNWARHWARTLEPTSLAPHSPVMVKISSKHRKKGLTKHVGLEQRFVFGFHSDDARIFSFTSSVSWALTPLMVQD